MIVVAIEQMTCGGCVSSVRNALTRAGFPPAEVAIGRATLDVGEHDEGAIARVRAAIEKAGFVLASVSAAP
jgi:copper chaperone CopZ